MNRADAGRPAVNSLVNDTAAVAPAAANVASSSQPPTLLRPVIAPPALSPHRTLLRLAGGSTPRVPGAPGIAPPGVSPWDDGDDDDQKETVLMRSFLSW